MPFLNIFAMAWHMTAMEFDNALRMASPKSGRCVEVTVPWPVIRQELRHRHMNLEDLLNNFHARWTWRPPNFVLGLNFVPKEEVE